MNLSLFNTLNRRVEEFVPLTPGQVGLYSCGPTVYGYAHIGNLRTYIFIDILKRALALNGFRIKHVMNVTDVGHLTSDEDAGEDKIQMTAAKEHKTAWEISRFYEEVFKKNLTELKILPPDVWCRATEHISEQISLIKKLEEKGFTYRTEDGIYFDTSKFKRYGEFAHLDEAGLRPGVRVEVGYKRSPTDFALWKFSPKDKKRDMEWESPWGVGFPGWHIECSAMSMKYLGEHFDIHTGGIDHIPVHHTNEIAQSEAATDQQFVRYWLHANFLLIKSDKMAKSAGTFLTLQDVLKEGFDPLSYRYLCLTAHYRSELNFTWASLQGAANAFQNLKDKIAEIRSSLDENKRDVKRIQSFQKKLQDAINDDLNIPGALGLFWNIIKNPELSNSEKYQLVLYFESILGLGFGENPQDNADLPDEVKKLVEDRREARLKKEWKKADEIRQQIKGLGYDVEDISEGTRITSKSGQLAVLL